MIKLSSQTALIHSQYIAPDHFKSLSVGIHHASTVVFSNVAAMRKRKWEEKNSYSYGLHGTPTTFTLEARLAEIENGHYCRIVSSGLAAIALINFAILKTGDDVLLPDNVYGPSGEQAVWLARNFGITARFYDPLIGADIIKMIKNNTRLIWIEAPGSVSMEIPDVPTICQIAHEKNIVIAIDNTWSAGLVFPAFKYGVDFIMQALTKYQSGGSDVLMGAVITCDDLLAKKIEYAHMQLGFGVGMDDTYMILRSLSTMRLRFEAHDFSARKIAFWLKKRPEITKVLHPALPDCPGHIFWKRYFTGAAGVFSVIFNDCYSQKQVDCFIDNLKLFKIGFSWGGAHSLCVPYNIKNMRLSWHEQGCLVRFNIGLEATQDLVADIEQGLLCLNMSL